MKVLGIDPGTQRTGWGVAERKRGTLRGIASGVITLNTKAPLADRLEVVHLQIAKLIDEHAPDAMAVEDIFYAKYASAAIKLGHVRGVALVAAARAGLAIFEYSPASIKSALVGYGRAEKAQVGEMVRLLLNLRAVPEPHDAADALAAAICHIHSRGTLDRILEAEAGIRRR